MPLRAANSDQAVQIDASSLSDNGAIPSVSWSGLGRGLVRVLLSVTLLLPVAFSAEAFADTKPAAGPHSSQPVLRNVELTKSGSLTVHVIDNLGNPLVAVLVQAQCGTRELSAVSDEYGQLSVPELNGGTCLLNIDDQVYACRVWRHGTAPPNSIPSIALVNRDPSIVRGNQFSRRNSCPPNGCDPCGKTRCLSSNAKYGLIITALGGTAAYMALSRDNGS